MGTAAADKFGFHDFLETVDSSCDGMFKIIQETSREKHSGKCVHTDGRIGTW